MSSRSGPPSSESKEDLAKQPTTARPDPPREDVHAAASAATVVALSSSGSSGTCADDLPAVPTPPQSPQQRRQQEEERQQQQQQQRVPSPSTAPLPRRRNHPAITSLSGKQQPLSPARAARHRSPTAVQIASSRAQRRTPFSRTPGEDSGREKKERNRSLSGVLSFAASPPPSPQTRRKQTAAMALVKEASSLAGMSPCSAQATPRGHSDRVRHAGTTHDGDEYVATIPTVVPLLPIKGPQSNLDDAVEFSMDAYRDLHKRSFCSAHEELTFLRGNYVSLRKTLMLVHAEALKQQKVLLKKGAECDSLRERLKQCQDAIKRNRTASLSLSVIEGVGDDEEGAGRTRKKKSISAGGARRRANTWNQQEDNSDDSDTKSGLASTPHGDVVRDKKRQCADEGDSENDGVTRHAAAAHAKTSPLWLYAAAERGVQRALKGAAGADRTDGRANDFNTAQLINELRRNLGRRDTTIDELRMDAEGLAQARTALEKELKKYKHELQDVSKERNAANAKLEEKAATIAELEEKLAAATEAAEANTAELAKLRQKCDTLELLGVGRGGGATMTLDALSDTSSLLPAVLPPGPVVSSAALRMAAGDPREFDYLQEQVVTYRRKWQSAEEQVDELQRQLSRTRRGDVGAALDDKSPSTMERNAAAVAASAGTAASVRRLEDELRVQYEEVNRLQRRTQREQENVAFREEQLRQQRGDDARHHRAEMGQLHEELRAAQAQAARAESERDQLLVQLQRTHHTDTMAETLQGQANALRQRVGELTSELAEARGREQELQLAVQRSTAEQARVVAELEQKSKAEVQWQRREAIMQEEAAVLRKRIGTEAGRVVALEQLLVQHWPRYVSQKKRPLPSPDSSDAAKRLQDIGKDIENGADSQYPAHSLTPYYDDGGYDAAAVASETKGYTALMEVNTSLQSRLKKVEEDLLRAREALKHKSHKWRKMRKNPDSKETQDAGTGSGELTKGQAESDTESDESIDDVAFSSPAVQAQRSHLLLEAGQLRQELERTRNGQRRLLARWQQLENEHKEVLADNVLLAEGTTALQDEVKQLRVLVNNGQNSTKEKKLQQKRSRLGEAIQASAVGFALPDAPPAAVPMVSPSFHTVKESSSSGAGNALRIRIQSARNFGRSTCEQGTASVEALRASSSSLMEAGTSQLVVVPRAQKEWEDQLHAAHVEMRALRAKLKAARAEVLEYESVICCLDDAGGLTNALQMKAATRREASGRHPYEFPPPSIFLDDAGAITSSAPIPSVHSPRLGRGFNHGKHNRRRSDSSRNKKSKTQPLSFSATNSSGALTGSLAVSIHSDHAGSPDGTAVRPSIGLGGGDPIVEAAIREEAARVDVEMNTLHRELQTAQQERDYWRSVVSSRHS